MRLKYDFYSAKRIILLVSWYLPATLFCSQPKTDSTFIDTRYYFYEPYPLETGNYILQLGGSFSILPLPIVENEYPVPALDLQYKHGIFNNLSIVASLSTNVFGNLLHSGIQWNTKADKFSFGIAEHVGGFYGFISSEDEFDNNKAYAFYNLIFIRMGYRFDDFSISMSWAASYIFNSRTYVQDFSAQGPYSVINDIFCTVAVEQPFLKSSLLSIGFSLNYARSPYQAWLLYNTIDQYLFTPEFFFGFQL